MGYWQWTAWFTGASLAAILVGGAIAHFFVFEFDEDDKRHHGVKRAKHHRPETKAQFFERKDSDRR